MQSLKFALRATAAYWAILSAAVHLVGCSETSAAPAAKQPTPAAQAAYEEALAFAEVEQLPAVEVAQVETPAELLGDIAEPLAIIHEETAAPEVEPPLADPPPPAAASRLVTIDGAATDFDLFVKTWYRGKDVGVRGMTIEKHLVDHGVTAGVDKLTRDERFKLHSAIHARDKAAGEQKTVVRSRTVTSGPIPQASSVSPGCPNGRCPTANSYQYRTGIFGRQRMVRRR